MTVSNLASAILIGAASGALQAMSNNALLMLIIAEIGGLQWEIVSVLGDTATAVGALTFVAAAGVTAATVRRLRRAGTRA
jgi:hypothetical protein